MQLFEDLIKFEIVARCRIADYRINGFAQREVSGYGLRQILFLFCRRVCADAGAATGALTMMIRLQRIGKLVPLLMSIFAMLYGSTIAQASDSDLSELSDAASCAIELGLSPASLVVTEIVDQNVAIAEAILQRLDQAGQLRSNLASLHDDYDALGQQIMMIAGGLRANPDDDDLVEDYSLIATQLENVRAQITLVCDELILAALEDCTSVQLQAMTTWQSSRSYDVPASFRVTIRDDAQWRTITRALRAERRAIRRNEPFNGPLADLLAETRGEPAVIAAENRLALYLTSVEQVFMQFEPDGD